MPSERITGRLTAGQRPGRVGNDARPVEVPAAVDVGEPRDRHRQVVGVRVGASDQVGAGLGHVVGEARLQRKVLAVGQLVVVAVGLVGRGHDHLPDRRPDHTHRPARLQQEIGSANVGLERGQRGPVGRADDRLRRQVEHRGDVVLVEHADEGLVVEQVGLRDAPVLYPLGVKARLRLDVAPQGNHAGARIEQALDQPGAEEALRTGDQDRAVPVASRAHGVTGRAPGAIPRRR